MKVLIVEDDLTARKLLLLYLRRYAACDIAVDGLEAIKMVQDALKKNNRTT